jgi:hypothetical protein
MQVFVKIEMFNTYDSVISSKRSLFFKKICEVLFGFYILYTGKIRTGVILPENEQAQTISLIRVNFMLCDQKSIKEARAPAF